MSTMPVMPSLVVATLALLLLVAPASALDQKQVLSHLYSNSDGPNWTRGWDTDADDVCSDSYPGVSCDSNGRVSEIDLSGNNLSGSISPHVYTLKGLTRLDVSKNRLTSAGWNKIDVVVNQGNSVSDTVEVIDLTNNLVSSVEGLGKLNASLKELHMTYNNLKGTIPSEYFDLPMLEVLAISENALDGTIDTRIGQMESLLELYCYGNKITGTIPSEIGELNKIQLLTVRRFCLSRPEIGCGAPCGFCRESALHFTHVKTFCITYFNTVRREPANGTAPRRDTAHGQPPHLLGA